MYDRMSDRIVALSSRASYPAARLPALPRLGPATGVDTGTHGEAVTSCFGERFQRAPLTSFLETGTFVLPARLWTC